MMVVAILALIIIGPKDLPGVMRSAGQWANKARSMSREFRSSVKEMISEAELDDAKNAIQSTRQMSVDKIVENTIDPTGTVKSAVKDIDSAARTDGASAKPASKSAGSSAEAKAESAGGKPADADPAGGDQAQAKVIKTPLQKAPPHSIVPPPEPGAPSTDAGKTKAGAADEAAGQKSA